ncbi:MAG: ComEC family competence protein [Marinovum sp.]|nr:ComEC family competence protein [Marinovum sp.]
MRAVDMLSAALLSQQGRLMPWGPVCFGVGISMFFALRFEPGWPMLACGGGGAVVAGVLALRTDFVTAALLWGCALLMAGFALAGVRAHVVAGPVLDGRYYGPIEGRVVGLDRSGSGAYRVTLDQVRLSRMAPDAIPKRVRISLHSDAPDLPPAGVRIMTTGYLSSPGAPNEPGGFDFQRHAWFLGLGGVGYTRVPLLLAEPKVGWRGIFGLRRALSSYVQQTIDGPEGGFAAAITTGDRSGLDPELTQALRDTNLAHLLAISGLHMGLLTGFIFAALQLSLSLLPRTPMMPSRKWAAVGALAVGAVYLALSGGNVATERAFVMVAVAFSAVLIDRRAISLRSVAVAALIVLSLRPEALLSPGFQMSFAATIALVAAFQVLTRSNLGDCPVWSRPVVSLFVSASVAGFATLPFAAAHFNRMPSYGLLANLSAPPVMGMIVVPAGVLAALLAPFGLDRIGFWIMEQGLNWIVFVATSVASWDGAVRRIPAPPSAVLVLLALGGLWIAIILGRWRPVGLLPVLLAGILWLSHNRADILVAPGGALVGAMTDEGRALSKDRGAGFVAEIWLENDGDDVDQATAAARWSGEGRLRSTPIPGGLLFHVNGKRALAEVTVCRSGDILIASVDVLPDLSWECDIYDLARLRDSGGLAFWVKDDRLEMKTARAATGRRLWNDKTLRAQ